MIEIRTSSFSQTGLTDDSNRKSCMKSAEKHWGRKSKRLETRVGFDIYQRKQENYKNSWRTKSCALLKAEAPEWHSSVEIKAEECTQSVTVKQLERNRILILTAEGVVFSWKTALPLSLSKPYQPLSQSSREPHASEFIYSLLLCRPVAFSLTYRNPKDPKQQQAD